MIASTEQYPLNLSANRLTGLVDSSVLRALRGVEADTIHDRVEAGEFKWVWDLSVGRQRKRKAEIRELRFWMREIVAPQTTSDLTLEEVLKQILPPEQRSYRSGEISQKLFISRPTLMRLGKKLRGEVVDHSLHFTRSWLLEFLHRRWLQNFRGTAYNNQNKNN